MKVSIKKLNVEMEVKNKGIEFDIYSTKDEFLGDVIINRKGITWCKGKQAAKNGVQVDWAKFITWMEGE